MLQKPIEEIVWQDIERLVDQGRLEERTLEFKRDLPGGNRESCKEFLSDISSFANSDGGDIIFGVREHNGAAVEITPIKADNLDSERLRLENLARDALDPRIPGLKLRTVESDDGESVLIVRIPASFIAPHRVKYRDSSRFFGRNSGGKFPMDTQELRDAFTSSEGMPAKLRALHSRAVEASQGKEMPRPTVSYPTMVVTVAPLSVLRSPQQYSVSRDTAMHPPTLVGDIQYQIALEGIIVHRAAKEVDAWATTHRRGYIDFAWMVGRRVEDRGNIVWPMNFTDSFPAGVRSAIARLNGLGIDGPWAVMATLRQCQNYQLILDRFNFDQSRPAWRDEAYLGDVISDHAVDADLQPLVDNAWRLFGMENPNPSA